MYQGHHKGHNKGHNKGLEKGRDRKLEKKGLEKGLVIAVVGATGNVGREILKLLEHSKLNPKRVDILASQNSKGQVMSFKGKPQKVQVLEEYDFSHCDMALFSCGGERAKIFAPKAAQAGCVVIDNSSHFRMDKDIALVVPEVNGTALKGFRKTNIIANPNCSTAQMVVVLKPLHDVIPIERVVVATYQSVSGAGRQAMDELYQQTEDVLEGKQVSSKHFTKQIAFNVIPHIDVFMDNGATKEEWKMIVETKKILDPKIELTAHCVRVPVLIGHSEALSVSFTKPFAPQKAREILSHAKGVCVKDEMVDGGYMTPAELVGKKEAFVSRIRQDESTQNGLNFWISCDNLQKGAALNAIQIAETLIEDYWEE